MYKNHFVSAIIATAGKGMRFSEVTQKPYVKIGNKPILAYTVTRFQENSSIDEIVLMVHHSQVSLAGEIVSDYGFTKVSQVKEGGKTRFDTVKKGLSYSNKDSQIVLVHDGVRPLVTNELIKSVLQASIDYGAAIPAISVTNTIKEVDATGLVTKTIPRQNLFEAQTPQAFKTALLKQCYETVFNDEEAQLTDDSMIVERCGYTVKMVPGLPTNRKITTQEDVAYIGQFL
ncbi:2-C-methyl-D-erythritol 4-phosphate cytidylyltransferase [Chlamydiota bacterium]